MAAEAKLTSPEMAVAGAQGLNAAKLAGEVLVPGASELIAGNISSGVGHFLINGVVVAALAPTLPVVAALASIALRTNAFANSTRGRFLWQKG